MENFTTLLKSHNRLINIIRCNPRISKSGLSDKLGLSWPTISSNIATLTEKSILSSKEGVQINPDCAHMVGISIGAGQIKVCIIDMNFQRIENNRFLNILNDLNIFSDARIFMANQKKDLTNYIFFKTPNDLYVLQELLDSIMENVRIIVENQDKYHLNIISLGITFTGAIDNIHQKIVKSHNLDIISNKALGNILSPAKIEYFEQKNINIYMDNNSTSAIVAEKYNLYILGNSNYKYKDKKNIMSIYLGAGIGAGLIFNNKLYRGATNFVGEIGHFEVPIYPNLKEDLKEPCCSCGNCHCLDFRIRNDVFGKTKEEFLTMDSTKINEYFINNPEKLDILAFYLGYVINLINNVLNLDIIIFTGKFREVFDRLWLSLSRQVNGNRLSYIANECQLISSPLGATSPSMGVAISAYFDKIDADIEW